MATVTSYTKEKMDDLFDGMIVGGTVDVSGHLILERGDGGTEDAGAVIATPGTPFVGQYTTAGRPAASGLNNKIYWDTTTHAFYLSNGSVWSLLDYITSSSTAFVGQYVTGSRPSAVALTGKLIWDITLGDFYKSNGTIWEVYETSGGGGSPLGVINMSDYAAGDGTDEYAGIQAAFNAVPKGGMLILNPQPDVNGLTTYATSLPIIFKDAISVVAYSPGRVAVGHFGVELKIHSSATATPWKKLGVLTSASYKNQTAGGTAIPGDPVVFEGFRINGNNKTFGNGIVALNKQSTYRNLVISQFYGETLWNDTNVSGAGDGSGHCIIYPGYFYDGTADLTLDNATCNDVRIKQCFLGSQNCRIKTTENSVVGGENLFTDWVIEDINCMHQPNGAFYAADIEIHAAAGHYIHNTHHNGSGAECIYIKQAMNARIQSPLCDGWGEANGVSDVTAAIRINQIIAGGGAPGAPGSQVSVTNPAYRTLNSQDTGTCLLVWVKAFDALANVHFTHTGGTHYTQIGATATHKGFRLRGDQANGLYLQATITGFNTDLPVADIFEGLTTGANDSAFVKLINTGNSWNFGTTAPAGGRWYKGTRVYNADPDAGEAEYWRCIVAGAPGTWESDLDIRAAELALKANLANPSGSGEAVWPSLRASGKAGATNAPLILGGGTLAGPPVSGSWIKGTIITDDANIMWRCSVSGSPGSWEQLRGGGQELGYAQSTTFMNSTTVGSASRHEPTTPLRITFTPGIRPIMLHFHCRAMTQSVVGSGGGVAICELATTTIVGDALTQNVPTVSPAVNPINDAWARVAPTAGVSITYCIMIWAITSGEVRFQASTTSPYFLRATEI